MEENEITLTENAINAIKNEMKEDTNIHGIRFSIISGGCQGLTYSIDYIEEADPADIHFIQDGVDVYIEPKAVLFLEGMRVDFKKTPMGSSFMFDNPNAVHTCGCGMSFSSDSCGEGGCSGCCGGCCGDDE